MLKHLITAAALGLAAPAAAFDANGEHIAFVEANVLGIFYHEFGHALIDVMELPVFGQEEDAADVASIFMIDAFFEEDSAVQLAYDTAFGFLGEAELSGEDIAWWDNHGPDLQRYYNLVCIFYGANPEEREDVAEELGLPEDRAVYCEEEYEQAANSWGAAFDEIEGSGDSIRWTGVKSGGEAGAFIGRMMELEIADLNASFELPIDVDVRVEACDEANAFYDPNERAIIMCSELAPFLAKMAGNL